MTKTLTKGVKVRFAIVITAVKRKGMCECDRLNASMLNLCKDVDVPLKLFEMSCQDV